MKLHPPSLVSTLNYDGLYPPKNHGLGVHDATMRRVVFGRRTSGQLCAHEVGDDKQTSKRSCEGEQTFAYRVLATSKTSTMQKELQEAGNAGFEYKGQTSFKSAFGGKEVAVLLERDLSIESALPQYEYRLLATKKTSTMQKELGEASGSGYEFVGLTVADTLIGGNEVVCILRRKVGT